MAKKDAHKDAFDKLLDSMDDGPGLEPDDIEDLSAPSGPDCGPEDLEDGPEAGIAVGSVAADDADDGLDGEIVDALNRQPELLTVPSPAVPKPAAMPKQIGQVVRRAALQANTEQAESGIAAMLAEIKNDFSVISSDILSRFSADQAQMQGVITALIGAMGQNPNNAERAVIETLGKLLEAKVTGNMTIIKLLEVKTKLLAAMKGAVGVTINNQNNAAVIGNNAELTELLSRPIEDDFE